MEELGEAQDSDYAAKSENHQNRDVQFIDRLHDKVIFSENHEDETA